MIFKLKEWVMSGDLEQHVNTNSAEFKQGVEAGLHSADDTKNWQVGNKMGQEPKQGENKETASESLFKTPTLPLFLRDSPEGNKDNPQDEKDETEE
jgi:hypothetical protein